MAPIGILINMSINNHGRNCIMHMDKIIRSPHIFPTASLFPIYAQRKFLNIKYM